MRRRLRQRGGVGFHLTHRGHGRERACKDECGGQSGHCDTKTHDVASKKECDARRIRGSGGPDCERRHFAIEPILLMRQGSPCLRHAQVTPVGWLALGAFRKLQAVIRVVPENVRLLHAFDMGSKSGIATENNQSVMGTIPSVSAGRAAAHSCYCPAPCLDPGRHWRRCRLTSRYRCRCGSASSRCRW
jgi:hypothetical protein